jgi:hypothetical protein
MKTQDEIYEKISSQFGIKFKQQLKNSPIVFESFTTLNHVVTKEESFLIIFKDKESIKFKNKSELIKKFTNHLRYKILELQNQFEDLNKNKFHGMKYDENDIFMQHEEIGHGQYKLDQLLKKFEKFKY